VGRLPPWLRGFLRRCREVPRGPGRFVLVFGLATAILFSLYYFPYSDHGISENWMAVWLRAYTRVVGWVLRVFDPTVSTHGNTVVGRFSMTIVKSCDAMEANILFVAATLALLGPFWRRAVAALGGLLALVVLNVVRLCCLFWVGLFFPAAFDFAHYDLWPLLMIAFATIDFVVCARWVVCAQVAPAAGTAHDAR
jgi:exosortase/archaeosortase family protein